jgi:hypothetical protein
LVALDGVAPDSLDSWREWTTDNVVYFARHNTLNGGLSAADLHRLKENDISGDFLVSLFQAQDDPDMFQRVLAETKMTFGARGKFATAVRKLPGFAS